MIATTTGPGRAGAGTRAGVVCTSVRGRPRTDKLRLRFFASCSAAAGGQSATPKPEWSGGPATGEPGRAGRSPPHQTTERPCLVL